MTKSDLLNRLGRDSKFMDFDLFNEAQAPGSLGGRAFDRAYMGFDFIGYSKLRQTFLLINTWQSEEERLFVVAKGAPDRPRPFLPGIAA